MVKKTSPDQDGSNILITIVVYLVAAVSGFLLLGAIVFHPAGRWLLVLMLVSGVYAIFLRRRLLASEVFTIPIFFGFITTFIIWLIVRNL